jgi:D-aminoacyl-tRNA deacylase
MRVLLQRVSKASVSVSGRQLARIDKGLLLLVGVGAGDNDGVEERLAEKICNLRIFADAEHKMNLSVLDVGGEALVVSQFTLYGDVSKGRRPSWTDAAEPGWRHSGSRLSPRRSKLAGSGWAEASSELT